MSRAKLDFSIVFETNKQSYNKSNVVWYHGVKLNVKVTDTGNIFHYPRTQS